ncbi:MAG: protein-glutamine gamma-glutamyltransferase [Actinomycetota bacterium]|nr:protein-glutamine gamma-glutamyltransferase [Actinomycetota bacterium]
MTRRLRPTRALALPLATAAVLYLLARLAGGSWLVLAGSAALVLPLVALLLPARLDGISVRREPLLRGLPGRPLAVVLTVRNGGARTTAPLRLQDLSDGVSEIVLAVPSLPPGAEASITLERTALRRGVFPDGVALLSSTAPLGLLRASREVPVDGVLIVHPEIRRVTRALGAMAHLAGEVPMSLPGAGTEVLGLRDWRSGDSARSVSARATARHGRPLVLEREREAGSGLVLIAGGPGRGPSWEAAVSYAASLALEALADGTLPVLLGPPPPGRLDRTGVLDWFAGVDRVQGLAPEAMTAAVRAAAGGTLVVLVPPALVGDRLALRRACDARRTRLVMLDA